MKVIVSGEKILSVGFIDYTWDIDQQVFDVPDYPLDENGSLVKKEYCRWVNGKVVKLTNADVMKLIKAKKFKILNDYIVGNMFLTTKSIADVWTKFNTEYLKIYDSEADIDAAISEVQNYIFT